MLKRTFRGRFLSQTCKHFSLTTDININDNGDEWTNVFFSTRHICRKREKENKTSKLTTNFVDLMKKRNHLLCLRVYPF